MNKFESDDEISDIEMEQMVKDMDRQDNREDPNEQIPDSRWMKLRATVREWGETASVHGIPHMAAASSVFATIVWSVILLFCGIGFIALFTDTIVEYLQYQTVVKLNLGEQSTNFPSVTFCNYNPYKLSLIQEVPELSALLQVYKEG